MAWDDNIEGSGREFAGCTASRIRCISGPGTGKTYSLMKRIQRLLEVEQIDPKNILVVTLTRTAADDLRNNLIELNVNGAEYVPTSTLHSLCFTILLKEEVLGITKRIPRLLAGFERDILIKDLPDLLGNFTEKKKLLTQFEVAWSSLNGTMIDDTPGSIPFVFTEELLQTFKFHECMLVDELVPLTLDYLKQNPYSEALDQYDHILVDEYQDLNKADHGVLECLAEQAIKRGGHIAIIGDEDQSIYVRLRHAHPKGINEFKTEKDFPLIECRRCPQKITRASQNLIQHNPGRSKPTLHVRPGNPPGKIHKVVFRDMEAEADGISNDDVTEEMETVIEETEA